MHFKLFYKQYDYKPTLGAIKQFKEATGKDLWSSLLSYMVTYMRCQQEGVTIGEMLKLLADELDFVESANLFYCLAKQANSAVTMDEIEDAMFHAGIIPSNKEHDKAEPYPIILYKLSIDIQEYHNQLSSEKKQ